MFMDKVKFVLSGVYEFLKPFIMQLLSEGGKILIIAAKEAVSAVATDMKDSPGEEKRKAAFAIIQKHLSTAGVTMATAVINSAIEAAVVRLKE
jgi:LL-H family phage holin